MKVLGRNIRCVKSLAEGRFVSVKKGTTSSLQVRSEMIWGLPRIGGTFLVAVPIIRNIVFGGLYWGPPI